MPAGPPPLLEKIAGVLLPPACREEVLGDLRETYASPPQYLLLAIRVAPFVFASRVRRATDAQLLLTQTILIYGSFLAGSWYSNRWLLTSRWGLLWPLIPTTANVLDLIFQAAWTGGSKWPRVLVFSGAFGICMGFSPIGTGVSALLVFGMARAFSSARDMPREASGPGLGFDRRPGPIALPQVAKNLLAALAAMILATLFLTAVGDKPGFSRIVAIAVFVLVLVFRSSPEGNRK